jgi:hypothetical protein
MSGVFGFRVQGSWFKTLEGIDHSGSEGRGRPDATARQHLLFYQTWLALPRQGNLRWGLGFRDMGWGVGV